MFRKDKNYRRLFSKPEDAINELEQALVTKFLEVEN